MPIDTQALAWRDIQDKLPARRKAVLQALILAPSGLTSHELTVTLGWPINSVSGRITELVRANLVYDSGQRRKNPYSGKPNAVWKTDVRARLF